jgi:hypothetical protein
MLDGIFDGRVRRDDGLERFLRVGGTTGVFWEACVGVASCRVVRTAVINHWEVCSSNMLQCCSAARRAAAARRLAAVKATRSSDSQHW